ncbi:hypothetical protein JXK06_02510 [Patescibacteria group bacterium]|nr:hypothetical protein [Patescibacteria group bacterium]
MKDLFSFENRTPKYENTGQRLETEFIGNINKRKYDELAFDYIQKQSQRFNQKQSPNHSTQIDEVENEFERMLQMREAASEHFNSFTKIRNKENYIDYKNSMDLVEKSQYGDPEKPNKFFSAALYNYIKNRFDEKYSLKFYTAAGLTHLDILHGVDCFFKLLDKKSGQEITKTTIDLTGNREKNQSRADVLIKLSQEEKNQIDPSKENKNFNKEILRERIDNYGEIIVQSLVNNYEEKIKQEALLENN